MRYTSDNVLQDVWIFTLRDQNFVANEHKYSKLDKGKFVEVSLTLSQSR